MDIDGSSELGEPAVPFGSRVVTAALLCFVQGGLKEGVEIRFSGQSEPRCDDAEDKMRNLKIGSSFIYVKGRNCLTNLIYR